MANVLDEYGREVQLFEAFAFNAQFEVKVKGYRGNAVAGQITHLDFPIGNEDRFIQGVNLILVNHNEQDTVSLSIVDKDGLYTPAGTVIKSFADSWNLDHDRNRQGQELFNFVARILAGLYIRISYTSHGNTDVVVKLNAYLHKKVI